MKKKLKHISWIKLALLFVLVIPFTSCTHNNGNIGYLFGIWTLESVEIDGEIQPQKQAEITWSFQNNIIWMHAVYDHEGVHDAFAYWNWIDGKKQLELDLSHDYYEEMKELQWGTRVKLDVLKYTKNDLQLLYYDKHGKRVIFTFRKLVA